MNMEGIKNMWRALFQDMSGILSEHSVEVDVTIPQEYKFLNVPEISTLSRVNDNDIMEEFKNLIDEDGLHLIWRINGHAPSKLSADQYMCSYCKKECYWM